jgi:predicted DNA-binding transcriptional regulator YafY
MRGGQLARQWQLIQRLARSRYGQGLDALAEELGCVRRTVYRDLDALMLAGFPVVSEKREGRVVYRFLESFRLGDVPFTPDEILALAMSEDLLGALEGTVFHDSIRSALAKIRAGLGPELAEFVARLGQSFRVLPGPHKSYAKVRETIRLLNQAVLERRTLRIRYRTGRTGALSVRELDPYRVWYRSGGLYVVGFDHKSKEIRTFAVDRIRAARATSRRFTPDPGFDFDATIGASFGVIAEPATKVRIVFEKRWADYVAEHIWHASQEVERLPDGRALLHMEVGGTAELRTWILSFGSGAEVQEPARLRDEVVAELRGALARYAAPAHGGDPAATRREGPRGGKRTR